MTASQDRATDTVVAQLGSTDSAAPEDPGPSTGVDWESASTVAKTILVVIISRTSNWKENRNARSSESRSRNRSGAVSRGTAQRNSTTSQESLYRRRRLKGPR